MHSTKNNGLSIYIEKYDDNVLRIESYPKAITYSLVVSLRYVSRGKVEHEYVKNIEHRILESLLNRVVNANQRYFLLSCLDSNKVSTYIMVLSKEKNEINKEADVICSIIENLSNNSINCKVEKSESAINILKRCLYGDSIENPLKWLLNVFSKRMDSNNINNVFLLEHPLSFEWGYPNIEPQKYEYLSKIFDNSDNAIRLGIIHSTNITAKLKPEHLVKHIIIVGATGSGKSTTASIIAREATRINYTVFIIDWHGEYASLLSDCNNIEYTNPVEGTIPSFLNLKSIIEYEPLAFIEILENVLELTPPQVHILEEAIKALLNKKALELYDIDLLMDIIQNTSLSARWVSESREALIRKLKVLSSEYLNIKWRGVREVGIEKGKILVFDVSSIPNTRVKRILASIAIKTATLKAQYNEVEKPLLIIVDEAHNIFTKNNPISNLIAEVRKWGVGFVIVTQTPSLLAPVVLRNANTRIIHAIKSSIDIKTLLGLSILKKEYKKVIPSLKPGEALVIIPELPEPILVKIGLISS
ncbi:ATP-binding protein [Ignisphaera sp. 4213-co]|uniref:ATP-binding protein n=1 Tax=Ignisphaera cupida TaxID=3050454 RepID=A0ABD4Z3P7_9CREN|nr:ATP-binding protein [Ignisphaera sp. 4213-co]MDK6027759.1 ATP-binding protein [Ignisphaera sp. 4213-co]